jgi:hypothetical protein
VTIDRMRKRLLTGVLAVLTVLAFAPVQAAEAAPSVRFTRIYFDSPGSDTGSNTSLNAEWVRIKNFGSTARTLTGWTVRDTSGHVYRFGTIKLKPGASVTLHTGSGTNAAAHRYWRSSYYIWNNTGDTATLKNKAGTKIDGCHYSGAGSAVDC